MPRMDMREEPSVALSNVSESTEGQSSKSKTPSSSSSVHRGRGHGTGSESPEARALRQEMQEKPTVDPEVAAGIAKARCDRVLKRIHHTILRHVPQLQIHEKDSEEVVQEKKQHLQQWFHTLAHTSVHTTSPKETV